MIIRFLTQNDVVEHNKVSSQAFVYSCDIHDPASTLPCEKMLGAFDNDNKTLFADLEIHEKKCNYDGGVLTCAAVGGVAAKPEHRGKGAVKALFRHLFNETEYDISILYPFSEEYYRKLGYERVGNAVSATVPFRALADFKRNQDATLYEGNDAERLLKVYNRCAERYNLSFVRETAEEFSDQPYLSQSYTYLWKNRSLATISVDRAKSTVFVKELWFDSCESLCGIVGFLRNFEANQNTVCFQNLPEGSPLLRFIKDTRKCEITLHNVGAARILNVEAVLRAHRYPVRDGSFTIRVGSESFRTALSENGVEIARTGVREPDVSMDIGAASRILLCGLTDAEYMPELTVRNPDSCFFRLFPPKTSFFTDSL